MGCIVNGPGEMADADYGYVGAGRGKISLYKGQTCIEKNIPEEEVPLADAPQTGDEAIVFAALTLLAGISLMAMHVSEKKRKEEV